MVRFSAPHAATWLEARDAQAREWPHPAVDLVLDAALAGLIGDGNRTGSRALSSTDWPILFSPLLPFAFVVLVLGRSGVGPLRHMGYLRSAAECEDVEQPAADGGHGCSHRRVQTPLRMLGIALPLLVLAWAAALAGRGSQKTIVQKV